MMKLTEGNGVIFDSVCKAHSVICKHSNIACSISGGKDSDIVLDLISKLDTLHKVKYVWFDTGFEYQATKDHLDYLETKYNITIERVKAKVAIPTSCRKYGQPFLTKNISNMIYRLQKHSFRWEDKPFDELYKEYPKCKSALMWWCNCHPDAKNNHISMFNINYKKFLKEFLITHPPWFPISHKCCDYAKKNPAKQYAIDNDIDLMITGIRRSEGGNRAAAYSTCFSVGKEGEHDNYRPLFWWSTNDETLYDNLFGMVHSACYEMWGMKRTGCVGCPFSQNLSEELAIIERFEPRMLNGVNAIFKDSYEYTRMYREFVKQMKSERKE